MSNLLETICFDRYSISCVTKPQNTRRKMNYLKYLIYSYPWIICHNHCRCRCLCRKWRKRWSEHWGLGCSWSKKTICLKKSTSHLRLKACPFHSAHEQKVAASGKAHIAWDSTHGAASNSTWENSVSSATLMLSRGRFSVLSISNRSKVALGVSAVSTSGHFLLLIDSRPVPYGK